MYKLLLFLLIAIISSSPVTGQEVRRNYLNRKTVAVGISAIGIESGELNSLLRAGGYPDMRAAIGVATLSVSTDFGPRWGAFYGADLSTTHQDGSTYKYGRYQYNRFYAGIEFTALRSESFELLGRAALSYGTATLRLYDTLADTASFTRYLAGRPDAKRFMAGSVGLDIGFQTRFRIKDAAFIGIGAGYILSTSTEWKHDAGTFDNGPRAGLGTWYIGARLGGIFHRRIISIPAEEFELREKRKRASEREPITRML